MAFYASFYAKYIISLGHITPQMIKLGYDILISLDDLESLISNGIKDNDISKYGQVWLQEPDRVQKVRFGGFLAISRPNPKMLRPHIYHSIERKKWYILLVSKEFFEITPPGRYKPRIILTQ